MSDLFERLIREHRAQRGLLEQMDQHVDDDPEGTRLLVPEVRLLLLPHARAEELVLYPALDALSESAPLSHRAREEHAVIEHLLDQLAAARVVDFAWRARLLILIDLVDQHIDEEEEQLAPLAHRLLGPERLAELYLAFLTARHRAAEQLGDYGSAMTVV